MEALYRNDDPCIDCGLCEAKTKKEMIEASRKIRSYLRSHSETNSVVKKIAVCGKGGVGKSTVTALMANLLAEQGKKALVIDTDESNPGLYRMLGLEKVPFPLMKILRRFSDEKPDTSANWLLKDRVTLCDIPDKFLIEKGNINFLMTGKITDPFEGCACSMAGLIKDLLKKISLDDNEVVIVDTEAGIESFGRGVERSVDTVLVVVEPSFESISLAEKIGYMAAGIGVNTVRAIINKVPSTKIEDQIIDRLLKANIKPVGSVYFDLKVNEDSFAGLPLGESAAKENLRRILTLLLQESF